VSLCSLLAACGGAADPPAKPAGARARPASVRVHMAHNRFLPHRITVHLGQTVRWTNSDAVAHTVASQTLRVSSEAIGPGKTFTYRPRRTGSFRYFCTIHFGQTGRLIVVR